MNRRAALAFAAALLGLVGCGGPERPRRTGRLRSQTVSAPPVLRTLRLGEVDLSEASICEAVLKCGPAWSYRVGCHPVQRDHCRRLYLLQADTLRSNPLAPLIGIDFRPELGDDEWFVEANGVRVWSPGSGASSWRPGAERDWGWQDPRKTGPWAVDLGGPDRTARWP